MSPEHDATGRFRAGAIVGGKYRIERTLGAGGMGVVVAARHLVLDEPVALKFLLPEALSSAQAIGRFIQEARAVARIKSEHVARVIDVGQLDDGSPFIVMEYLDGLDLSAWIAQRGPMSIPQAVDAVLQACEAIAEAHMRGIVHRDLKPANLFCVTRPDGSLCIKVLDFGISKVTGLDGTDHKLTRTNSVIGSPVYMSPEQMRRSRDTDARTDIWALGVILFELVTGATPFAAETAPELIIKVATEPPPALRALLPGAPPELELAVSMCLEKDREARFQSVGELAAAIQALGTLSARQSAQAIAGTLGRLAISGQSLAPQPESNAALPGSFGRSIDVHTGATWASAARRSRRTAIATGVGVVLGAGALVLLGFLLARVPETRSAASSAPADPAAPAAVAAPPRPVDDPATRAPPLLSSAMPPPIATAPASASAGSPPPAAPAPPTATPLRPSPGPAPRPGHRAPGADDRLGL